MSRAEEICIVPYQDSALDNRSGPYPSSPKKRLGRIDRHSVPIQSLMGSFTNIEDALIVSSPNIRPRFVFQNAHLGAWNDGPQANLAKTGQSKIFDEDDCETTPQSTNLSITETFHRSKTVNAIAPVDFSLINRTPLKKLPELRISSPRSASKGNRVDETSEGNTPKQHMKRGVRSARFPTAKTNSDLLTSKSSSPKFGENSLPPLRQNSCRSSGAKIYVQASVPLSSHAKLDWGIADYEEDDHTPPPGSTIFLKQKSHSIVSLDSIEDEYEAQKITKNFTMPLKPLQSENDTNKTYVRHSFNTPNSQKERSAQKNENIERKEPYVVDQKQFIAKPILKIISSECNKEKEKERNPRNGKITRSRTQSQSHQPKTVSAQLIVPTPSNKQPPLNKRRVDDIAESLHKQKLAQLAFSDSESSEDDFVRVRDHIFYRNDENKSEIIDAFNCNRYDGLYPDVSLQFSAKTNKDESNTAKLDQSTSNETTKKQFTIQSKIHTKTRLSDSDETRVWNYFGNALGHNDNTLSELSTINRKKWKESRKEKTLSENADKENNSSQFNGKTYMFKRRNSHVHSLSQETSFEDIEQTKKEEKKEKSLLNESQLSNNEAKSLHQSQSQLRQHRLSQTRPSIQCNNSTSDLSQSPKLLAHSPLQLLSPKLLPQSPVLHSQSPKPLPQSPLLQSQSPLLQSQSPKLLAASSKLLQQSPKPLPTSPLLQSQSPKLSLQSPNLPPQSPLLNFVNNSDHVKSPINSINLISLRSKRRKPNNPVRAVPFGETQLNGSDKNLTIIQVFYRNDPFPMFATLAITSDCTAKDICVTVEQQILENLPNEDTQLTETSCSLYEVEAQSTNDFETMVITQGEANVRLLSNDELVVPCLVQWDDDRLYRFYVQSDTVNWWRTNVNRASARSATSKHSKKTIVINVSETDSLWINENELTWEKRIGLGAFSKVYKAIYRGKLVAVKILKGTMDTKTIGEFRKEFEILRSTHHENLVHFYGACHDRKLSLVMEFCQRGTLLHVMNDPTLTFTMDMALNFAAQTCRALAYLHGYSPQIIHRDLKSLNLLVTKDWEIRISDFGLSRFNTHSNNLSLNNLCGTMTHCAPEIFMGESYTTKSDIYSMGIILWEMFNKETTGEYSGPFSSYKEIQFDYQIIIMAASKNLRPPMPAGLHPPLWQVLLRCWSSVPTERPDACLLERTILKLQFNYNSEKKEFANTPLFLNK